MIFPPPGAIPVIITRTLEVILYLQGEVRLYLSIIGGQSPELKTGYRYEAQYRKPRMGLGNFVDNNIFWQEIIFSWLLLIFFFLFLNVNHQGCIIRLFTLEALLSTVNVVSQALIDRILIWSHWLQRRESDVIWGFYLSMPEDDISHTLERIESIQPYYSTLESTQMYIPQKNII